MHISRRQFVILAASVVSAATLPSSSRATAQLLSGNDPTAQSSGYKTDAAQVNKAKFPRYQPGEPVQIVSCIKESPAQKWGRAQSRAANW